MPLPATPDYSSSKSRLRLLGAFVLGLMIQIGIASAQNLATNPGFETGETTGWFAFGPCTISAESTCVHSGNYAGSVTNRSATWNGIAQSFLGVLQPGQTYDISAWILLAGGSNQTMSLTMQESDSSGTSYTWTASGTVSTNGWTQLEGQYTFNPTGAVTSLFLYAEVPSSTNAAYYIDDLDVEWQNPTNGQCTVDWTNVFQRIDGFGFSTAWCGTLGSAKNNALYQTLGFSICRVQIDGIGSDQIADAAAAHAAGAMVLGTEWSVPSQWADTNGELIASNAAAYANWLSNAANTMGLDYVSFQNEPDGANWTPADIYNFVKTNCPAIGKPIAMPECIGFNDSYSDPVINDPTAVSNFTILAGHIYGGGLDPHINALAHGKHVWMTEHYISNVRDYMTNSILMAEEINNCMMAQMSAYVWWWVADWYDDDINLVDSNGNIYLSGYTFGQFSKFVRPGYYCIGASNNGATSISAYKDPASGNFAIVAINTNGSDFAQTFNLAGFNCIAVTPWITSQTLSLASQPAIDLTNASFTCTLPAVSVVTFIGQAIATNSTNLTGTLIGNNLILSWPADHTGWTLLTQTNNLNQGVSANINDWVRLPNSATTNQVVIPISSTQSAGYFRLVYP